jgi:galactokinase
MIDIADFLEKAGLSRGEASRKADLLAVATRALAVEGAALERRLHFFVPGRIEIVGKHTDYAGGRSLICATEQGMVFVAGARRDDRVVFIDARDGSRVETLLREQQPEVDGWGVYATTVIRRIVRNFPGRFTGAGIAFSSDLPPSAGLSSSSALICGFFAALAEVNDLPRHPQYRAHVSSLEDLAGYLGCVENGNAMGTLAGDSGVGTLGGSQDHTAILCSVARHLSRYRYSPVAREALIPLDPGHTFVVATSGIVATKTGHARDRYNRASRAVSALLEIWNNATGERAHTLHDALAADPVTRARELATLVPRGSTPAVHAGCRFDSHELADRLQQFVDETFVIVPEATEALLTGDLSGFGALVDRSQAGAESGLRNQLPETRALVRMARDIGAAAASSFGAGFGGSVWALVRSHDTAVFSREWLARYMGLHPGTAARARVITTGAGPPLLAL